MSTRFVCPRITGPPKAFKASVVVRPHFCLWLQTDIQPPENEVRLYPNSRHSGQGWECLKVTGLWLEPRVAMTQAREHKLRAELRRIQKFVGAAALEFAPR